MLTETGRPGLAGRGERLAAVRTAGPGGQLDELRLEVTGAHGL